MSSAIERCECSKINDRKGYHLLTCKTGGGPIWSHESVANVWCDSLRDLNITHRREPRNLYEGSNSCPDIIAFDAQSGYDIELDISLAHPWNEDIILQASKVDGAAAAKRESQKTENTEKRLMLWEMHSIASLWFFSITAAGDGKPTNFYIICPYFL